MHASRTTEVHGRMMAKADNQGTPGSENVGVVVEACQQKIVVAAKRGADGQPLKKQRRTLNETIHILSLLNAEQIVQTVQDTVLRKPPTWRKTKKARKAQTR